MTGLWVLGAFLAACGGDAEVGSADGSTGNGSESGSTTDEPGTTTTIGTSDPSTSTTATPTTDVTATATTTSTTVAESSTTDPTDDTSGSSSGCTLGELDCACDEGTCADGLDCDASDICVTAAECQDDEWGEILTEDTAYFLGMIDDDDDNGGNVMGVLTGPDDVDWFRYDGDDTLGDTVDPFRTIAASAGVRFCKFAECPDGIGDTSFSCEDGSVATTSPDGRPGCCADSVIIVPEANCTGTIDDDMAIWIRVDSAEEACVQYAFDYHF